MESNQNEQGRDRYFDLIERVGDKGRYQWIVYTIILYAYFCVSVAGNNVAFLFMNPHFDCS